MHDYVCTDEVSHILVYVTPYQLIDGDGQGDYIGPKGLHAYH